MFLFSRAALALLGIAGAGAIALYTRLNGVLRHQLETHGSAATGTSVRVREISVLPLEGSGGIGGLTVGNPEGFKTTEALRVESIRVRLEPKSLLSSTVVVKEVVVDSPQLTWEVGAGGGNLGRIRKTLEGSKPQPKKKPRTNGEGRKVVIDRLVVRNGRLRIVAPAVGPVHVSLPELVLNDIGRKSGGATAQEAVSIALDAVIKSALDAAGSTGQTLSAAKKAFGKAFKGLFGEGGSN